MEKSEILITTGISFFLLCSMGIDSPAPQGQMLVIGGMLVSACVTLLGIWFGWIEKGQRESIKRTMEIRRAGKIAAEDTKSTLPVRKTERGRIHNRDSDKEKAQERRVI
ncbi:hypothetical protein [Agathobacter rectalis]|jgi:hypothetical protein|uniref:Uncharacterized protein n=1 Tax=Agathobacter rectalis TaxID=39491 RepID=A0A174GZ10_9FIRM|nr:hypothetical protein [Agathobacter rectalis]CUO66296.1 Uncharacterised protein [Agathobacter rectalis]DAP72687.1 MAG TPA: hypothetical protein [Caudoviricetes sp.]